MISQKDFQKKSFNSDLITHEMSLLHKMMRNYCVLCAAEPRKPGERLTLYASIKKLLDKAGESSNAFLRGILADFLRIEVEQRMQESASNRSFVLDTTSLNKIGDAIKKHLSWKKGDEKKATVAIEEAHIANKKALGSKSWKLGLLAGLIAAAAGAGYAFHKHNSKQKEEDIDDKK